MKIYLNGKLVPEKDAKVSVFDHGLLYGDIMKMEPITINQPIKHILLNTWL